jgi:Replication-relaxation
MNDSNLLNGLAQSQPPLPTTKKPRLPRYKRVDKPPKMVLTQRDKEIIGQVYLFRLMTREQIEKLLFPPDKGQDHPTKTSSVRKRLKLLYQHEYLERVPAPIGPGVWAWRPVYRLAEKGAEVVAAELGLAAKKLKYWGKGSDKDHRSDEVSLMFFEHARAINDVRIAVTLAAKKNGFEVEKWVDDNQLKSQEMKDYVTVKGRKQSQRVPVIPDAYFILNMGKKRAHFFLELDRATMSSKRWKTRVLGYRAYTASGKYQERYHTTSLRILTVTTTEERLSNLKKTTEQAGGNKVFWFTTIDQVTVGNIFFSPIWSVANDSLLLPLIS